MNLARGRSALGDKVEMLMLRRLVGGGTEESLGE